MGFRAALGYAQALSPDGSLIQMHMSVYGHREGEWDGTRMPNVLSSVLSSLRQTD